MGPVGSRYTRVKGVVLAGNGVTNAENRLQCRRRDVLDVSRVVVSIRDNGGAERRILVSDLYRLRSHNPGDEVCVGRVDIRYAP